MYNHFLHFGLNVDFKKEPKRGWMLKSLKNRGLQQHRLLDASESLKSDSEQSNYSVCHAHESYSICILSSHANLNYG